MRAFTFNSYREAEKIFFCLVIFFLLISCLKDEALTRNYPRLNTPAVTDIKATEAIFHAEIISGEFSQVVQYGFTWNEYVAPRMDLHEHVLIAEPLKEKSFSSKIQSLESNRVYFCRPFIKTNKLLIYGPVVSFKTSK